MNAVLTTPPKFSLQSPRTIKNLYFFRNIHFLFFLITFLWTRRMRWLQPRWRVVDKRPQMFRSKCKNGKKYIIQKNDLHKGPIVSLNAVLIIPPKISLQSFFRKFRLLFFAITFLWTRRMQWLQRRRRVFNKWRKMFRSRWRNVKKTYILKKMICIKIPLSLWMQCWSPRRRFPCSLREWHKTFPFFGKSSFYFFSIRSDGHEECSDYNLANVFSTKGRKCFPEFQKKQKKTKNIKKLISIKFLLSRWMHCWPPRRSFPPSLQEWYKTYTFFEKSFFVFSLITFLWTRRMRWLQPRWRVVDKRPQMFRSKCKNGTKYIIQKKDLHKGPIVSVNAVLIIPPKNSLQSFFRKFRLLFFAITFLWTGRMQWLQRRRRVFNKWRKMFHSRWKNVNKKYILKKKICIKIPLSLCMQCWSPRRRFPCSLREWHKTFPFFGKSSF